MSKELEALNKFLKEYLFLCEKLNTNMQEKMLLDSNSPYNVLKKYLESIDNSNPSEALECLEKLSHFDVVVGKTKKCDISTTVGNYFRCEIITIKQALTTKSKKELVSDIITNKLINYRKFYSDFIMSNISYDKYVEYWTNYGCEQLTEQEFNFLKEMANNE